MIREIKDTIRMVSTVHKPDNSSNVYVFSTPRSGSTWLMELIYTQPDFKWGLEPFNLRRPAVSDNSGISDWTTLYNDDSLEQIERYFRAYIMGELRDRRFIHPKPFSKHYRPITKRMVFKILHFGEHRINWFRDTFNGRIVYLVRHPIPVSLSREVYPRLEAFVTSDYKRHFSEAQLEAAHQIIHEGSKLERGMMDWCLQNAVPLQQATEDWIIVTYEQMVLNPFPAVSHIASQLNLPHPERMLAGLDVPSGSTSQSDAKTQQILNQNRTDNTKQWLVEKWRKKVSPEEEEKLMKILELFDLDIYTPGDVLPAKKYWIG